MSKDGNPNVTLGEQADIIDADLSEAGLAVQLSEQLAAVRDRILAAKGDLEVIGFRGELTLVVPAERIVDVLAFCRDDAEVRTELLADLSGVHWPGGVVEAKAEETTGWPTYHRQQLGRIEVDYSLYSLTHNHRFRLRVEVDEDDPVVPTATAVFASANIMEREVYDFFGVTFTNHPNLTRVLMPEDWEGYPHRKDYPLGGVEVAYKGASIPPPDQRSY